MLNVALGHGEALETRDAARAAIEQCRREASDWTPQAGILYAAADFDLPLLVDTVNAAFPGIELIGCSTNGELSSALGFSEDSVCLLLLGSDTLRMKAGVGRNVSADPRRAAQEAVTQARAGLEGPETLCLALPDGFTGAPSAATTHLNAALHPDCALFGASAATQVGMTATRQFYKTETLSDALPVLLVSGPLRLAFSVSTCWQPLGPRVAVTESSGDTVRRIGDVSALDFYRRYLGSHSRPAFEFPLAVFEPGSDSYYLRVPATYDEASGSVRYVGDVPQDTEVQLTEAVRSRMIACCEESVARATEAFGAGTPAVALIFTCAVRKMILGTRTQEESAILARHLPPGVPVFGFYAFGEIGPTGAGGCGQLHNSTMITLLLGERDEPA